ncbi:MAG: EamA family transporter, partial [Planctomycetes bacterium]|nr:EamA family transporter [Planctomycetota bacterium]
ALMWLDVLSRLPVSVVAPMGCLMPILASAMSWALWGERMTPAQLAAGGALLAGLWLLARPGVARAKIAERKAVRWRGRRAGTDARPG